MANVHIKGLAELRASLEQLKVGAAKNALVVATRKASKVVVAEARAQAPVGDVPHKTYKGRTVAPGFLSRNIRAKVFYSRTRGLARAEIGPSKEAFYGTQFLEVGTSKIPKRPWLVPAYEQKRSEVEQVFVTTLRAAIERAVKRGNVR